MERVNKRDGKQKENVDYTCPQIASITCVNKVTQINSSSNNNNNNQVALDVFATICMCVANANKTHIITHVYRCATHMVCAMYCHAIMLAYSVCMCTVHMQSKLFSERWFRTLRLCIQLASQNMEYQPNTSSKSSGPETQFISLRFCFGDMICFLDFII